MWSNCGEWVSIKTLSWASSGRSTAAVRMHLILNKQKFSYALLHYCFSPAGSLMCYSNVDYSTLQCIWKYLYVSYCWCLPWQRWDVIIRLQWCFVNELIRSVQFTAMSTYWNRPRWPYLWWSHSRPECYRCRVAELIRWSSQTMKEVRLEFSWG